MSISECCTGDHLLLPCNFTDKNLCVFFFFLPTLWFLNAFHQENARLFSPCLHLDDDGLLIAKGRTASLELGTSCSVCASASLLTIPHLCFLCGFPASNQVNFY